MHYAAELSQCHPSDSSLTSTCCISRTKTAEDVPLAEQAISGRDYEAVQATVDMFNTVARVPVEITINR